MSSERIIVGVDIGSNKVCTLVGEMKGRNRLRILGLGIEPSAGVQKGTIVDVARATEAVQASKAQAERTSGYEIVRAFVGVSGRHITALASRGVTGLSPARGVIGEEEMERALQAARAVALPHQSEILHVIPRAFTVDGKGGIRNPIGQHAYRLEVETYIITAASSALRNLEKCVSDAGLLVDRFVLNQLAAAEAVLTDAERESGVLLVDLGAGTMDMAVFIDGTVWHTAVLEMGGSYITNDIATVLYLPPDEAERAKVRYGHADSSQVPPDTVISIQPFGEERPAQILAYDLACIIEARVEELFTLVMQELKRSGYDGLLSAGVVLTGGTAALPGVRQTASRVMNLPVRVAQPENIGGLADRLRSPAYSTAVGLLYFAYQLDAGSTAPPSPRRRPDDGGGEGSRPHIGKALTDFLGRLLPD